MVEVDIREAAEWLNITIEGVRKRIQRGKLTAVKVDGEWRITLPEDRPRKAVGRVIHIVPDNQQPVPDASVTVPDKSGPSWETLNAEYQASQKGWEELRAQLEARIHEQANRIAHLEQETHRQDSIIMSLTQKLPALTSTEEEPHPELSRMVESLKDELKETRQDMVVIKEFIRSQVEVASTRESKRRWWHFLKPR